MTQLKKFLPAYFLLTFLLIQTSCSVETDLLDLSEGEAVEIIEAALQDTAGGLTTNLEDMAEQLVTAITSGEICDSIYTKIIADSTQGVIIQTSYSSMLTYEMTCNNFDIPQTASISSTTESIYNSNRIESNDNGNFSGNASGLQPSISSIDLTGNYNKTGNQELNFSEQKSINSTFTADLVTLQINKQNYNIESGNGTFSLTGSTQDAAFSYLGDITFNGGGSATLTINGITYEINLN
ncbi:MAG: hypothetical protein AB8F94_15120 [Saprospiraceae bacterium]